MKILFATDGSPQAEHALDEALRFLPSDQIDAYVIGVAKPHRAMVALETASGGVAVLEQQALLERDIAIARAQARLAAKGIDGAAINATGDPGHEILASARQLKPDLIVLGSHGHGALGRLVLGSVCDHVAHRWDGALLIVRPAPTP